MDMKTKNSQIRFLFCLLIMSSSVLGLIIYTSLNASISQNTRNEASNEQIYMFDNKRPEDTEEVSWTEKKINSESAASTFKSRNEHSASNISHNKSNNRETITSDSDRKSNKLLKIYIYNLSSEFNEDISQCITSARLSPGFSRCFDYSNYGMGRLLYQEGGVSVLNTNQFSLDVILHHQLLHSKYRTDDPTKADIFYIPAYMGSLFFCQNGKFALSELTDMLFRYLNSMPYFAQGKPHVTSLSKIEREEVPVVLAHNSWINITYIAIEKDSDFFRTMLGIARLSVIVAPYPSYVHLNYTTDSSVHVDLLSAGKRRTFLFLASSLRKSCELRAKVIEQFSVQTQEGFENFYKSENNSNVDQVLLVTVECMGDHHNKTIHWMQNSVFCLQPHGDSPTRKSFYDSILSGCIPVVFQFPEEKVEFPFQRILNYTEFTVHIPVDAKGNTENNSSVYDYLRSISLKTINTLQTNLKRVLHLFQYPLITKVRQGNQKDAVDMIVEEIQAKYKL